MTVTVRVQLVGVGDERTVIARVRDPVIVLVWIADIADVIAIRVDLIVDQTSLICM